MCGAVSVQQDNTAQVLHMLRQKLYDIHLYNRTMLLGQVSTGKSIHIYNNRQTCLGELTQRRHFNLFFLRAMLACDIC
jgi:hypothetical protein